MSTPQQPMADSRDMIVVHDMFRREFKAIPSLVSGVPEGDPAKTAIVADHVTWMVSFLHGHHQGEDELVWPKLLDRIPAETDPLILTMEAQHEALATGLDNLAAMAAGWRRTSAAKERDAVAGAAAELLVLIAEHLALEERKVLSLIDRYLTAKEWDAVGGAGLKKFSFREVTVSFGMILNGATPEQVQIMRNTLPPVPFMIFSFLGPRAYVRYAARLHSASTVSMARSAA